jgi:hypothetical protein
MPFGKPGPSGLPDLDEAGRVVGMLGAVLNIWLNVNLRIVTDGSVQLLSLLVDKTASRAQVVAEP